MKAWWKSKTIWFNVASVAVMLGSGQFGIDIAPNVAVPLVTAGNVLLRILTAQPVGATDQP